MKKFQADYIFPVNTDPIKNGIVTVDDFGKIMAIEGESVNSYNSIFKIEKLDGVLCPGFVNTHCHVELSHLKDIITPQKGLVNFIKEVQSRREIDEGSIVAAAVEADEEMYRNGIVAVGDISNSSVTVDLKKKSKIYYHNFIEVFGFVPLKAKDIFNDALALCEKFKPLSHSITAHAPYSVSKELFKYIGQLPQEHSNLVSIHNQETEEENKLYRYKSGGFIDLYEYLKIDIDFFKPQARNSLQSIIPLLTKKQNILLVHNTYTNLKDIYFTKRFDRKINWCFCPNANLYIEARLPKLEFFVDKGFNITLGTDSLASNKKLCILNEMLALQQHFKDLNLATMLPWATLNGAKFLGIEADKGSIQVGKTPGLNLISNLNGFKITPETTVKRII